MTTGLKIAKLTVREGLFALGVFALLLLGFGHQPVFSSGQGAVRVDAAQLASDWCGETPAREHDGHGPCHACRVSIADLPRPASAADPAFGRCLSAVNAQACFDVAQKPSGYAEPTRGPPIHL